jgi:outer membrane protein assembly factor BamA
MRALVIILLMGPILTAPGAEQTGEPDIEGSSSYTEGRQIIREIRFHGLKRTTDRTILRIIRPVEVGGVFTEDTEELIIQELRETGIFNPEVRVESLIQDGDVIIDVYVRDKWTLIPIPFFAFSKDGSWSGGLMGIESNLLGLNKTLGLGVFFGSFGWSGIGFYRDPLFLGSDMTLRLSTRVGINDEDTLNPEEDVIREYRENTLRLGMGLTYPFSERLSVTGEGRYAYSDILSGEEEGLEDMQALGFRTRIRWIDLYYDIPYQYGLFASAEDQFNGGLNGTEPFHTVTAEAFAAFNPVMRHQLKFALKGAWSYDLPVQEQFPLGGAHGSFTLPGDLRAEHYALGFASYSLPLLSFRWGTLTARALYEAGFYESDLIDREFYQGPGAGMEIYLNDIAIPAFILTFGWNLETGNYQVTAGVGVGRD